jgi:hypothetical protein
MWDTRNEKRKEHQSSSRRDLSCRMADRGVSASPRAHELQRYYFTQSVQRTRTPSSAPSDPPLLPCSR